MTKKNNSSSKKIINSAINKKNVNNNNIRKNSKLIKKFNTLFLYLYNFFISFFKSNKDGDSRALVEKFYGIKREEHINNKPSIKLSIKKVGIFPYLRNSFISFFKPSEKKIKIYFRF